MPVPSPEADIHLVHPPRHQGVRFLLGVLVLLVALLFLKSPGTSDVRTFLIWMQRIGAYGATAGYALNSDVYPPLYAVIFWLIAKTALWLAVSPFVAYKVSLLLAWLLTGLCLRPWTRDDAVIAAILLALLPSSLALGYFDIYLAPLLLLSLWAAREQRWTFFSASFTVFALTKPQGLILVPFAAVFAAKVALGARAKGENAALVAIELAAPGVLIAALTLVFFGASVTAAAQVAVQQPILSGNALNVGWIFTHYVHWARPDLYGGLVVGGVAQMIGLRAKHPELLLLLMQVTFFAIYGLILVRYARAAVSLRDLVLYSLLGMLAYCVLMVGVHENHLFYPSLLSIALFLIDRSYRYHALYCAVAANANLILFYGLTGSGLPLHRVVGVDMALPLACLNAIFFFTVLMAPDSNV